MVASPCWVCANNRIRPPGRVASMAVRINPFTATARITASAPRPSVSDLIICTVSELDASIFSFRPKALDIVSLCGNKSEVITRAPRRRANTARMMPIGPWPITRTVSPALSPSVSIPFRQVLTGSIKDACSKETPSGMRTTPFGTIQSITRTYSEKPPPLAS